MKNVLCIHKLKMLILALVLPVMVYSQSGSITGSVVDADGEPLIGVNVIIKGTTTGTVSDIDGNFSIKNLELKPYTIEVSFIGYLTENYPIDLSKNPNQTLNVVLVEDVKEISEVVVIGYGTQKKSDLTSAVASVSAEDLKEARAATVQEALQGKAAGVVVSSNTGAPGSDVSVKIRGITSINGTDPIWVVDGVRADPNSVNAADIESMEILKDASSAAIYGANAGSGVILITTKKGKEGDTKVTFNAYRGVQKVANQVDVADGPTFAKMLHEYETLANKRKYFSTEPDTFPTYDYQDMIFRSALMQNYDLGVSGGNEKSTFYMGIGYTNQEGILKSSGYEKISVRLNGQHEANSWLKVGINSSYTRSKYIGFEEWELKDEYASPILGALAYHSFVPPYGEKTTDSEYDEGWSYTPLGNTSNPLATVSLKNREAVYNNGSATVYGIVSPMEGLSFESKLTGSISYNHDHQFYPIYFVTNSNKNSVSSINKGTGFYSGWNWQNLLTYNKTFFEVHNLSLLAGMESGYGKSEWMRAERFSLINQSPEMWYFNASTNDTLVAQIPSGTGEETSGYSYLGRISYDYKGMILGQFNFRRDYSSLFGPNNRSGNFPSFSVGFKFTELDAVRNAMPFMNFGKVRFGWGKVGNNSIKPYQYYSTVAFENVYNYSFNNDPVASSGAAPNLFVNRAIHWEEVVTSNFGFDFGFFDNKLSASIDYFERHNNGMLMTVESPWMAGWIVTDPYQEGGVSDPIKNVGEFNNSGIELSMGWKEQIGAFRYSANANFTYIKTTVGDIEPDTLYSGTTKGIGSNLTRVVQGQNFEPFYGYKVERLFRLSDNPNAEGVVTNQPFTVNPDGDTLFAQPNAKPGDFKFKDVNGDGKIDEKDMVALGSPNPKFTFALNLNASYDLPNNAGTVDFKAFLQGAVGNKVFNATKFYLFNTDGAFNWGTDYAEDHYTVELYDRNDELVTELNDDAKYPRVDPRSENANFSTLSDFYVEDASYLRIKNLEIGYTLPEVVSNAVNIESFRIYGAIKNLATFTKYSGLDPEVGTAKNEQGFSDPRSAGIDKAAYPVARMYTIGVNVSF